MNNKKTLLFMTSLLPLALTSCSNKCPVDHDKLYQDGYNAGYQEGYQEGKKDQYVRPGNDLSFHSELQQQYIDDSNPQNISKYAEGRVNEEKCVPTPVKLTWNDFYFKEQCTSYKVVISDDISFTNPVTLNTNNTEVDAYNLKLNTKYYWYVEGTKDSFKASSPVYNFTMKDGLLRNIYVPGSTNWRDLGNYMTSSGKKIKQGLIYRSAAFGFYNGESKAVSEEAKDYILNQLKIKTNIDLAGTESITGLNVIFAKMEYEGIANLIADTNNQKSIAKVFTELGNSDNYPAVFHCTRGRDRTGAIAFLLEMFLGMDINDIYRDYLFTNFSADNACTISTIKNYMSYLSDFEGATLKDKTKSYLISVGVNEQSLNNITSILLA